MRVSPIWSLDHETDDKPTIIIIIIIAYFRLIELTCLRLILFVTIVFVTKINILLCSILLELELEVKKYFFCCPSQAQAIMLFALKHYQAFVDADKTFRKTLRYKTCHYVL